MSTPLSTYLSTPATNAPATTAMDLMAGLTPELTAEGSYSPADPADVVTLYATQEKYGNLLWPRQPDDPIGISTGDLVGLMSQAVKDIRSHLPVLTSVTTNGSSVATVDLTPYGFSVAPHVTLTPVNAAAVAASVTAVTATSLSIITSVASVNVQIMLFV